MSGDEAASGDEGKRCGHPTRQGGLCQRSPMAGGDRCHQHGGLEPTEAEKAASRSNPIEHGYFVSGFLDERERAIFEAVASGEIEPSEIQRQAVAALVVRAMRMLEREAQGGDVAGLTTGAFAELRKSMEAMDPDAFRVEHAFSDADIARQVQRVLREDDEVLLQVVPPEARKAVEEALV